MAARSTLIRENREAHVIGFDRQIRATRARTSSVGKPVHPVGKNGARPRILCLKSFRETNARAQRKVTPRKKMTGALERYGEGAYALRAASKYALVCKSLRPPLPVVFYATSSHRRSRVTYVRECPNDKLADLMEPDERARTM